MGHAKSKNFVSAPLQMSPENGKGFNCFFPMPFRKSAKIAVKNGMIPLRDDGLAKVKAGITTLEELSRSTAEV